MTASKYVTNCSCFWQIWHYNVKNEALQFRGYFQPVRPELLQQALYWLNANNPWYKDIVVNINDIDNSLITLQYDDTDQQCCSDNNPANQTNYLSNDNQSKESKEEGSELNNNNEDDDLIKPLLLTHALSILLCLTSDDFTRW